MERPIIDKGDYLEWAKTTWQEYASYTNRDGYRIRFNVNYTLEYRIYLGGKILYQGYSFDNATHAFVYETSQVVE